MQNEDRAAAARDGGSRAGTDPNLVVDVDRVPFDGTYVRVSSIGLQQDRQFVLVAGLGISATYYERLAPNLNEFGPVHALDLPGFAGVPRFRGPVSMERYADAVECVIDTLGLVNPVLVGHSMGTQIITEVAARRPDLTDIVLISPVADASARSVVRIVFRFMRASVHEPRAVQFHAVTAYALCGIHWFRRVLPKMIAYPIERRAADVEAHTLIIRGEYDAVVPRAWVRRLARTFPYAVIREVVDGAHSVMHAQADVVAALAVSHVRGELHDHGAGSLRRVRDTLTTESRGRLSVAEAWMVVRSRFAELFGMAKEDDTVLEQAKSDHAEATASASADLPDVAAAPALDSEDSQGQTEAQAAG